MRVRWNLVALSVVTIASAVFFAACGKQSAPPTNGVGETATKPAETKREAPKDPEAAKGKLVFIQTGCNACHMSPTVGKDYPDLRGLYGSQVKLKDGTTVVADEAYLREAIVEPNKKIVAGYQPTMPPYSYLKEEQVNQLIAYIKSLKDEKPEFAKH